MRIAGRFLIVAAVGLAPAIAGCADGGDYIPLAKVEEPKNQGQAKSVGKKPAGVGGSPASPVYK